MTDHHQPRAPRSDQPSDQSYGSKGSSNETPIDGRKPISPEHDDFDAPPPRRPPETSSTEELPDFPGAAGSEETDIEMLALLSRQLARHSMRSLNAAEKIDPAGQLHERLANQGCKFAATAARLAGIRADIAKKSG